MSDGTVTQKKSGIVALVGRPNAGKSTLLNNLLGEKVSIVSDKPQTTRNRIVGVLNDERGQIAFLDTPGIHRPLHKLNVRMMDHVISSLAEADIVATIVDASEDFGHGDEYVINLLRNERFQGHARVAVLNKIDLVKKHLLLPLMQRYGGFGIFDEIVPISASRGEGTKELLDVLFKRLPEGEARFPEDVYTTQPERFLVSEIIREKLLRHTMNELPYTTAVHVDKWEEEPEKDLLRVYASIYVERDSQKKIVIGHRGDMIKAIGSEARQEIEQILGTRMYLDLRVAVHERWREDERFLGELEWPLKGTDDL